jgi:hypothetical protein
MPISEVCFRMAVGAFVVGVVPFILTIIFRHLDNIPASDSAFVLVVGTVAVAVVSLFTGIIAKARETPPT